MLSPRVNKNQPILKFSAFEHYIKKLLRFLKIRNYYFHFLISQPQAKTAEERCFPPLKSSAPRAAPLFDTFARHYFKLTERLKWIQPESLA